MDGDAGADIQLSLRRGCNNYEETPNAIILHYQLPDRKIDKSPQSIMCHYDSYHDVTFTLNVADYRKTDTLHALSLRSGNHGMEIKFIHRDIQSDNKLEFKCFSCCAYLIIQSSRVFRSPIFSKTFFCNKIQTSPFEL